MVNVIVGTSSNDTLTGINSDNNLIYGNEGADRVTAGTQGDKVFGWTGNDTLIGSGANDAIGGDQDNDSIDGGAGDDQLYGGDGQDTILGGAGEDFVTADAGNDSVDGGNDDDVVYGGFGNDTLAGGNDDDFLSGEAGDDSLVGGAGLDELYGGYDNNNYVGGAGRDRFILSPGDATIDGNDKIDTINDFELGTVATGGPAEDLIDIRQLGVATFAELQTRMTEVGSDVHIDFSVDYDRILVIKNVTIADLFEEHFRFPGDNQAPTASGDNYSVPQDGLLLASSVLANDTDPNNDILTAGISSGPAHAALFQFNQDGSFTYQPTAGYVGTDSFTYIANDGEFFSNSATVTITIGDVGQSIPGTPGDDTLTGGPGDDTIDGGPGDDTLTGGDGDDSITGSDGDDTIDGGDGDDTIDGGNGDDSITGGNDDDVINGGNDDDTIDGGAGNDTINGGAGDDSLVGGTGNDAINGGEDDDYLEGNAGIDTLNGNGGNDTLQGGAGGDQINGSTGLDVASYRDAPTAVLVDLNAGLLSGSDAVGDVYTSIEGAEGSAFDDTLTGDAQDNWLSGRGGNDTLTAMDGNDTLFGGAGTDALLAGAGNDLLEGGAGADVLDGSTGNDTISYASSTVAVNVNLLTSTANGGDATGDTFTSIENLTGSANNDTLTGDTGANVLSGLAGNDSMNGGDGNDTLLGGDGNDLLQGAAGDDSLSGEAGNDTFLGSAGADVNNGGAGTDTADYSASAAQVNVNLNTNTATGGDAQGDTFSSIEVLIGSANNDTLSGSSAAETLLGGAGDDSLFGGAGNDSLGGGAGQDTLTDGIGNDTLTGGANDDIFVIGSSQGSGTVDNITDLMNVTGDDKIDLRAFPTIDGFDDLVITTTGPNTYSIALPGSQTLIVVAEGPLTEDDFILNPPANDGIVTGTAGNDVIDAAYTDVDGDQITAGNDTIVGLAGNDSILGLAGNDNITGGTGNDTLSGDAGSDTYNFTFNGTNGFDRVIDTGGTLIIDGKTLSGTAVATSPTTATLTVTGTVFQLTQVGADLEITKQGGSANDKVTLVNYNGGWNFTTPTADGIVTGTAGNDVINAAYLDADGDQITAGNDTIVGLAGNDSILGLGGNDNITGGTGNDTLSGDAGSDTYNFTFDGTNGLDRVIDTGGTLIIDGKTLSGTAVATSPTTATLTVTGTVFILTQVGADLEITKQGGSANDKVTLVNYNGGWNFTTPTADGIVTGTAGNDLIDAAYTDVDGDKVTTGNDTIVALGGNDTITALDGNDSVDAGAGNDSVEGGAGNDTLNGGAGNDTLSAGNGSDSLLGGDGDDFLHEANGAPITTGGNDTFDGGAGNDALESGYGNDLLIGGTGNDTLRGEQDNDTYTFTFNGTNGTDHVYDNGGTLIIDGKTLAGSAVRTGPNSATLTVTGTVFVLTNVGPDMEITKQGGSAADKVILKDFNGNWGITLPPAGDGTVDGTGGNDVIDANYVDAQGDKVTAGNDLVLAGAGNDRVEALGGNDTVQGGDGSDALYGGAGNDSLVGGEGHDYIYGGAGQDTMDGGATSFDYVSYVQAGSAVAFSFTTGTGTVGEAAGDVIMNFGGAEGSGYNDTIIGDANRNSFRGFSGNDSISGLAGDDIFHGGDGADTVDGGTGNDIAFLGGNNNDAAFSADLAAGTVNGIVTNDVFISIESVSGGRGNDTIQLGGANGILHANGYYGNDSLVGTTANNLLNGDGPTYDVTGTYGNDTIDGGAGNDTIIGDQGNDSLIGGSGSDLFTFTFNGTNGIDTVHDDGGTIQIDGKTLAGTAVMTGANTYTLTVTGTVFVLTKVGVDLEITKQGGSAADKVIVKNFTGNWGITIPPVADGIVSGTAGNDNINASYVDVDGDKVTTGNDTIVAGSGNDTVLAQAGNDSIDAGAGNDNVSGEAGNDTIFGGTGNDTLNGNDGADRYEFTFNGTNGIDHVYDNGGTLVIDGKTLAGTAVKTGVANQYSLTVSGTTFLLTKVGNDLEITKSGGSVNDKVILKLYDGGFGITLPPVGDGKVDGTAANNNINASYVDAQGDQVTAGADTAFGYAGNDTITGLAGNDVLYGDSTTNNVGNTVIPGTPTLGVALVTINALGVPYDLMGFSNDYIGRSTKISSSYPDFGVEDDELDGVESIKVHFLGETNKVDVGLARFFSKYNEKAWWKAYDDQGKEVDSGFINATSSSGSSVHRITAAENFSKLEIGAVYPYSLALNALTWGSPVAETIPGTTDGNDSILGGDGNDTIFGGGGNDTLSGDAGNDLYKFDFDTHNGSDRVIDADGGTLVIDGKTLIGTATQAIGIGSYKLTVSGTTFELNASGSDMVITKAGDAADKVTVANFDAAKWGITLPSGPTPNNIVDGTNGYNFIALGYTDADGDKVTLLGAQHVKAYDGNDNVITYLGNDTLDGGKGNDQLEGGMGDDLILGGEGNDQLHGDAGNDTIIGGKGSDYMRGGVGSDLFIVDNEKNTVDRIVDFSHGNKIQIEGVTSFSQITLKYSGLATNIYVGNDLVATTDHHWAIASDFAF